MQFAIIARDYKDQEALSRRENARTAHIALSNEAKEKGQQLYGVAMLNDEGKMCGSVMIVDFPSQKEVDAWLAYEPYVVGKVWEHIEIVPCRVGPSFNSRVL